MNANTSVLGISLFTLAALVALSPLALAQGPQGGAPNEAQWQQMTEMRDIMHYGVFQAEKVADGVRVTVTSDQAELAQTIAKAFGEVQPREGLLPPETETKVTPRDDGVTLEFTSRNSETVAALQAQGNRLGFWVLRDRMHQTMFAAGYGPGAGKGYGPGWMHGPGAGQGYGPGWMHGRGPGAGQGYGPGGMHGSGAGYGPGWMHGPGGWTGDGPGGSTTQD